jgi:putative IMPACT (imprinted ancient) family translation regulator
MAGYLTIAGDAAAEIEVKRSRFRCTLVRVCDEAGARPGRPTAP